MLSTAYNPPRLGRDIIVWRARRGVDLRKIISAENIRKFGVVKVNCPCGLSGNVFSDLIEEEEDGHDTQRRCAELETTISSVEPRSLMLSHFRFLIWHLVPT
ncbi:hypothetical protein NPIL_596001 [Nephila pilipes]|uniref:Uncharacterized protein n=1 Tax=Nephila pilipes TaxID=299642 RepID=A0A8X6QZM7_NEPPI|nr:hypothetical protein NPIL_596001 [Nephila pilipes]